MASNVVKIQTSRGVRYVVRGGSDYRREVSAGARPYAGQNTSTRYVTDPKTGRVTTTPANPTPSKTIIVDAATTERLRKESETGQFTVRDELALRTAKDLLKRQEVARAKVKTEVLRPAVPDKKDFTPEGTIRASTKEEKLRDIALGGGATFETKGLSFKQKAKAAASTFVGSTTKIVRFFVEPEYRREVQRRIGKVTPLTLVGGVVETVRSAKERPVTTILEIAPQIPFFEGGIQILKTGARSPLIQGASSAAKAADTLSLNKFWKQQAKKDSGVSFDSRLSEKPSGFDIKPVTETMFVAEDTAIIGRRGRIFEAKETIGLKAAERQTYIVEPFTTSKGVTYSSVPTKSFTVNPLSDTVTFEAARGKVFIEPTDVLTQRAANVPSRASGVINFKADRLGTQKSLTDVEFGQGLYEVSRKTSSAAEQYRIFEAVQGRLNLKSRDYQRNLIEYTQPEGVRPKLLTYRGAEPSNYPLFFVAEPVSATVLEVGRVFKNFNVGKEEFRAGKGSIERFKTKFEIGSTQDFSFAPAVAVSTFTGTVQKNRLRSSLDLETSVAERLDTASDIKLDIIAKPDIGLDTRVKQKQKTDASLRLISLTSLKTDFSFTGGKTVPVPPRDTPPPKPPKEPTTKPFSFQRPKYRSRKQPELISKSLFSKKQLVKYTPTVTAAVLNLRGKRPSLRLAASGVVDRPLAIRRMLK